MTFLNFADEPPTADLFRITSVDRFVQGLEAKANTLVRPKKWDDPFEAAILNAYGVLPNGGTVQFRLRWNYFGQCWSRHKETDLMWRAYSPGRDGAKLQVSASKLHESLDAAVSSWSGTGQAYLGAVRYKRKAAFDEILRRGCDFGAPTASQAQALLVKRFGFRSEREVRLIAYAEFESAPDLIRYPVDWNDLVERVVLDPRMSRSPAAAARSRIRAAGYDGKVVRSGLYKEPKPLKIPVQRDGTPRSD